MAIYGTLCPRARLPPLKNCRIQGCGSDSRFGGSDHAKDQASKTTSIAIAIIQAAPTSAIPVLNCVFSSFFIVPGPLSLCFNDRSIGSSQCDAIASLCLGFGLIIDVRRAVSCGISHTDGNFSMAVRDQFRDGYRSTTDPLAMPSRPNGGTGM